jgi:aspartyl protease family protein
MRGKASRTSWFTCFARRALGSALILMPLATYSADQVTVLALFRDKAVLMIDGQRRALSVGETAPEGGTLISANAREAVLELDGRRRAYGLGSRISTAFAERSLERVSIYRDTSGMFTTVGSLNGYPVNFLVDTGATSIAMNAGEARRMGIPYRLEGRRVSVQTASGVSTAYAIKLETVKVGEVIQRNVDAVVLEGKLPRQVLLGMSYLGRFRIRNEGQVMHLERKY